MACRSGRHRLAAITTGQSAHRFGNGHHRVYFSPDLLALESRTKLVNATPQKEAYAHALSDNPYAITPMRKPELDTLSHSARKTTAGSIRAARKAG